MMEKRSILVIDEALDSTGIELFLSALNAGQARILPLQVASSYLSDFITGGPYRRGDTFITGFWEMYQTLDDQERSRVEAHYKSKIESIPEEFKKRYPKVFRK
jgi:hypothetical protein